MFLYLVAVISQFRKNGISLLYSLSSNIFQNLYAKSTLQLFIVVGRLLLTSKYPKIFSEKPLCVLCLVLWIKITSMCRFLLCVGFFWRGELQIPPVSLAHKLTWKKSKLVIFSPFKNNMRSGKCLDFKLKLFVKTFVEKKGSSFNMLMIANSAEVYVSLSCYRFSLRCFHFQLLEVGVTFCLLYPYLLLEWKCYLLRKSRYHGFIDFFFFFLIAHRGFLCQYWWKNFHLFENQREHW